MFGRSATKLETVIGVDSTIQGELSIQGTVRVDGNVEGDIRADCVIVGETGKVRGNVKARTLVVGGRVDGNVAAAEAVELRGRAQVFGEICTARLSVSEGALFEGQSCMKKMKETTEGKEGKIQSLAASRTAS